MKQMSLLSFFMMSFFFGCASAEYSETVSYVDLDKFFKKWYVIAGRVTFLEKGAHNAIEEYSYNVEKQRIDINFYYNKNSFSGPVKSLPQKGWIENETSNAHWKISPFWPLKFDYLIIALAEDYSWTAVGVPSQKYLWIMSDNWKMSDSQLEEIIRQIQSTGYLVDDVVRIPQKW
jgi:apolipoprotein D and lipocalin family protein